MTPVLGLDVKLGRSLFELLPQNVNRAGSALSIIYSPLFLCFLFVRSCGCNLP